MKLLNDNGETELSKRAQDEALLLEYYQLCWCQ